MKFLIKKLKVSFLTLAFFTFFSHFVIVGLGFAQTVLASGGNSSTNLLCKIFPFISSIRIFGINSICGSFDSGRVTTGVSQWIQFGLTLVFVGIIVVSIFYVISAAIRYIRSEGDESKVKDASKAIKAVFVGLAALFIGLIGIVIILAVFQVEGGAFDTQTVPPGIDNFLPSPR